jgi:hypothetical protein
MLALALSLVLAPAAAPKEALNPRQVAERYVAATLSGKAEDAIKFAQDGKSTGNPKKVREFKDGIGVGKLALPKVYFSDKKGYALAVSEEINFPQEKPNDLARGVIIVTLKRNKDGVWQVNDLDSRTAKDAARLLEKAAKALDDWKEIPNPKS